uniref:hypothetical protein n=1 Tax=Dictyostelium intermedium TaxID=361076 RepID=UPI001D0F5D94|nr:hypothetical protein LKZ32_mgp07 [Dictyostelium intermedium]DAZ85389.1 TPA_asm: hypothetical protein [Dictyostelium intermedium]
MKLDKILKEEICRINSRGITFKGNLGSVRSTKRNVVINVFDIISNIPQKRIKKEEKKNMFRERIKKFIADNFGLLYALMSILIVVILFYFCIKFLNLSIFLLSFSSVFGSLWIVKPSVYVNYMQWYEDKKEFWKMVRLKISEHWLFRCIIIMSLFNLYCMFVIFIYCIVFWYFGFNLINFEIFTNKDVNSIIYCISPFDEIIKVAYIIEPVKIESSKIEPKASIKIKELSDIKLFKEELFKYIPTNLRNYVWHLCIPQSILSNDGVLEIPENPIVFKNSKEPSLYKNVPDSFKQRIKEIEINNSKQILLYSKSISNYVTPTEKCFNSFFMRNGELLQIYPEYTCGYKLKSDDIHHLSLKQVKATLHYVQYGCNIDFTSDFSLGNTNFVNECNTLYTSEYIIKMPKYIESVNQHVLAIFNNQSPSYLIYSYSDYYDIEDYNNNFSILNRLNENYMQPNLSKQERVFKSYLNKMFEECIDKMKDRSGYDIIHKGTALSNVRNNLDFYTNKPPLYYFEIEHENSDNENDLYQFNEEYQKKTKGEQRRLRANFRYLQNKSYLLYIDDICDENIRNGSREYYSNKIYSDYEHENSDNEIDEYESDEEYQDITPGEQKRWRARFRERAVGMLALN